MLCGLILTLPIPSEKVGAFQESGSIFRQMARRRLDTESTSCQKELLFSKSNSLNIGFGIYPIENPNGSLRNKTCTPTPPLIMRTGSHPKPDFNSPHSPV